ncbi:MAG: hypothetical protein SFZ03_04660 [Candidatus Melainabacteria bacterium]|nr:hypothetical protein [Candidatus Melainabacteria bacterium]
MSPRLGNLMGNGFQVTSLLRFWEPANLPYLLSSAIILRTLVGVARTLMDLPQINPKPNLPEEEKFGTFFERINMELVGTLGYMGVLHVCQDVSRWALEHIPALRPQHFLDDLLSRYRERLPNAAAVLTKGVDAAFGVQDAGILKRVVYDTPNIFRTQGTHSLYAAQQFLQKQATHTGDTVWNLVKDDFVRYQNRLMLPAFGMVLTGVAAAAYFGGYLMQLFNDRVVGQSIVPALNRLFGVPTKAQQGLEPEEPTAAVGSRPAPAVVAPAAGVSPAWVLPSMALSSMALPVAMMAANSSLLNVKSLPAGLAHPPLPHSPLPHPPLPLPRPTPKILTETTRLPCQQLPRLPVYASPGLWRGGGY